MPTRKTGDRPKSRKLKRREDKLKVSSGRVVKRARQTPEPGTAVVAVSRLLGVDPSLVTPVRPRRAATMRLPPPRYIVDPVWGPVDPLGGASWMEVTIGPAQGGPGMYGSTPAANTPPLMRRLLDGPYNAFGWIAGHLLNDNLGGPGEARNLTPLSTAGNKNHLSTCETRIKNFINAAYSRTNLHRSDDYYYGVYYRVQVGTEKWDLEDDDLQYVATELLVWAHVVKMHKISADVTPAIFDETPITTWFAPMAGVKVDNTGYDQLMV